MRARHLVVRSLRHYWRTNLAIAVGVGIAVSALSGALVVGDSVRTSLRELALSRLGQADYAITATTLFTEQLGERLDSSRAFTSAWRGPAPVLTLEGLVVRERSGARAGGVQVYGVDDRFWTFNGVTDVSGPAGREAYVSPALGRELGASPGDALLLRVQKPSTIPAGLIQGRRDEPGRGIRLSTARVLPREQLGDFSPRPQQGATRAIFVPLERLQRDLELQHRVNMLLVARVPGAEGPDAGLVAQVEPQADLADLGIRMRPLRGDILAIESDTGLLSEPIERSATAAAGEIGVMPVPVLTYLATSIKANGRETPYSLVSAVPPWVIPPGRPCAFAGPESLGVPHPRCIWLTQWTAEDLGAGHGDEVELEYYLWSDAEGLTTSKATFRVADVLPMEGLAIDSDLTPQYPGVSTSANMTDWDPPFPVDLKKIRPKDEDYWDRYLTAPKAFIEIDRGQELWQSRYGRVSSLRLPANSPLNTPPTRPMTKLHAAYRDALPRHLKASAAEFRAIPLREQALAAAAGTTDFGEYFTYFSFFLVVSSLLLTLLFFRLGIEQRAREVGLLAALGYSPRAIRGLLLYEGAVLAAAGALLGIAGALAYAWLIMFALRTWWVDAVGTTDLDVHLRAAPLLAGAAIGVVAGLACIAWSLRVLRRSTARQLISGAWIESGTTKRTKDTKGTTDPFGSRVFRDFRDFRGFAVLGTLLALALVASGFMQWIPPAGAFFGSGTLLLIAGLCAIAAWLRGTSREAFIAGAWPIARLGLRNARYRPARSVLSVALIAAATFLIVAVGAFRRGAEDVGDAKSASGGFTLIGETLAPLMHDPSTPAGRSALNLGPELEGVKFARFRLRPGDDASCLNLYRPQNPRLLGATEAFMRENRFSFARTIDAEQENPWLLLNRRFEDGAVPVIGDATSLAYVFHLAVGDDYVMQGPDNQPLRLRIVGALRDSVLQSELIMSDASFTRLFPRNEGFRVFLVEPDAVHASQVATALEDQLQDFGMDVQSTAERLASYHRVENTFLTTFQALGALGLVLGTLGLGTVLLRNVLERRRELALLQATGYRRAHLVQMVLAESAFLLACGLALGVLCAAVAIAPAYMARAQAFPLVPTLGLLAGVLAAGFLSTIMATRAVATLPLLEALKNE